MEQSGLFLRLKALYFLLILVAFSGGCAPVKYVIEEPQKYLSVGEEAQIQVLAAGDWRNSGIMLKKGERYKITATGKWHMGGACNPTGPDGIGVYNILCWDLGGHISGFTIGALIAKIGEKGKPFGVGESIELNITEGGFLFFRSNDLGLGDNKGAVSVTVKKMSGETLNLSMGETAIKESSGGIRSRIAVLSLKPNTRVAAEEGYGDVVSDMLITGLTKTGRFEVLERSQIKHVLNEKQFNETDVVAGESAINVGQILKVKYLVIGSVAKLGNLTEVDIRFVDTENGKVLLAENVSCQSLGDLRNAINSLVNKVTASYPGRL